MGARPRVSAIIIFFNERRFIREAIESVFNQTYDNWELLLVDDGSTDSSTEIAKQYADKYPRKVRYLDHQRHENRGMSASRNLGIWKARGEYIALGDADDVWLPHKLARHVEILDSQPEVAMVYGPVEFFSGAAGVEDRPKMIQQMGVPVDSLIQPPELLTLSLKGVAPLVPGSLLRREVVTKVGAYEESFRGLLEDQVFLAKLLLLAPVLVCDDCVYRYRIHESSCTSKGMRTGAYDNARQSYLSWLENHLKTEGICNAELWQAFHEAIRPYRHPLFHLFFTYGQRLHKGARSWLGTARMSALKAARVLAGNATGSIKVRVSLKEHGDPIGERFRCVVATLSWEAKGVEAVEVRVGSPDGALLSRGGAAGNATTGRWVQEGMLFYLQDVTNEKQLSPDNTLDVTSV